MTKPSIKRTVIFLKAREFITPNYIRLTFTGENISSFANCTIGANNKIFLPPKGIKEVYFADELEEKDIDKAAIRRTYTHAGIDLLKNEMYMEFVAHGDEGPASNYAIHADIGAPLGVAMKIKNMSLAPKVNFYYIIGDPTALPVIKAMLESLNLDVTGKVFLEVPNQKERQNINKPKGIEIYWIENIKTADDTILADRVISNLENDQDLEKKSRFAFVACEYANVRKLRNFFRKEKKWEREELSAYSYWKFGIAETKSEKDRREERQEA